MTDVPDDPAAVAEELRPTIEAYFDQTEPRTLGQNDDIPLNVPSYGADEVVAVLEKLLSTWVTMGDEVFTFEDQFAEYVGTDSGLMVNSGSSANLVLLKTLRNQGVLEEGDEVLVPACTWSTTVAPILDVGCEPVFIDVNPHTFNVDVDTVTGAITNDTAALFAVHLLGNPAPVDELVDVCTEHDVVLLEDCCEAHGAAIDGQRVGSFGHAGTYSFFFSHHICTMEGGMVVGWDGFIEDAKPVRAHGWYRERDDYDAYASQTDWFDPRFTFEEPGLNVRPTDIQGVFGQHQLRRLDGYLDIRRQAAEALQDTLDDYDSLRYQEPYADHSYYGFGVVVEDSATYDSERLAQYLENNGIETRPVMGGNLAKHPAFEDVTVRGSLTGAEDIMQNGLFVGIHHGLTEERVAHMQDAFEQFLEVHE